MRLGQRPSKGGAALQRRVRSCVPRVDCTGNKCLDASEQNIWTEKTKKKIWRVGILLAVVEGPVRENTVADNGTVEAIRKRHGAAAALIHSSLIEGSQSGMQP